MWPIEKHTLPSLHCPLNYTLHLKPRIVLQNAAFVVVVVVIVIVIVVGNVAAAAVGSWQSVWVSGWLVYRAKFRRVALGHITYTLLCTRQALRGERVEGGNGKIINLTLKECFVQWTIWFMSQPSNLLMRFKFWSNQPYFVSLILHLALRHELICFNIIIIII